MLDMLISTSGVLLEKANVNDDCCLTNNSISASEDGSSLRSPLVKSEGGCEGVRYKKTFQQWVDYAASTYGSSDPRGLCFENWYYVLKGILRKTSTNNGLIKCLKRVQKCIIRFSLMLQI